MASKTFPEHQSICSAQRLLAILILISARKKSLVLGERTGGGKGKGKEKGKGRGKGKGKGKGKGREGT